MNATAYLSIVTDHVLMDTFYPMADNNANMDQNLKQMFPTPCGRTKANLRTKGDLVVLVVFQTKC